MTVLITHTHTHTAITEKRIGLVDVERDNIDSERAHIAISPPPSDCDNSTSTSSATNTITSTSTSTSTSGQTLATLAQATANRVNRKYIKTPKPSVTRNVPFYLYGKVDRLQPLCCTWIVGGSVFMCGVTYFSLSVCMSPHTEVARVIKFHRITAPTKKKEGTKERETDEGDLDPTEKELRQMSAVFDWIEQRRIAPNCHECKWLKDMVKLMYSADILKSVRRMHVMSLLCDIYTLFEPAKNAHYINKNVATSLICSLVEGPCDPRG